MKRLSRPVGLALALICTCIPLTSLAQGASDSSELAKQASNPVSSLISLPFQWNYDRGLGFSGDGEHRYLRFQPVLPISLNDNWNLVTRAIITYNEYTDVTGPGKKQSGFGDTALSFFLSPNDTAGGWIWGAGPVISIPSYDDTFSSDQWGAGITGVALRQMNGWSIGGLASQTWGINPPDGEDAFSALYLQPFVSYSTPTAWTLGMNSEATYNWNTEDWSFPVNLTVSKIVRFGNQPVQFQAGVRHWFDNPDFAAQDTGFRLQASFLFPK